MELGHDENLYPILLKEPQLHQDLFPIWEAFHTLSGSRSSTGFGPGSIPYPSIILYLDENEIRDRETRMEYIRLIQAMDHEYIKAVNEVSERKRPKTQQTTPPPRRR